ncbi:hypothetical protein DOTSEDRAFT_69310 [Lecanosticta acicola]|uniref:Uncharacterized protein n=1 Tax=Lecanosticta acicola TaxID=111012 RepID=A0AAI8Z472_9PEZI|nr:hypothetical protein DOTSEDRAFT_69310 [Lecanosticta acicola]
MLERATASLKAGACDSLQRIHRVRAPRSRRLLHSAFWNHGAGDLDLPPWAVSLLPMPTDLPLKSDGHLNHQQRQSSSSGRDAPSHAAPLLDFLYPPNALAWLHKTSCKQRERSEIRNAQRLPDGSIQASRRYSSRSSAQSGRLAPPEKDALSDHIERDRQEGARARQQSAKEGVRFGSAVGDMLINPVEGSSKSQAGTATDSLKDVVDHQDEEVKRDAFADSPADLAELENYSSDHSDSVTSLRVLRNLLKESKVPEEQSQRQSRVSRAWALFSRLQEDDKADTRLKNEFIAWLVAQHTEVADAHCISLYWALPTDERSLSTYQAALAAFLRRDDMESALGLQKEALKTIANGSQITLELFRYAMKYQLLDAAVSVKKAHDQHYADPRFPAQSNQGALFWLGIAEMPDLIPVASALARKIVRMKYERPEINEEEKVGYTHLVARIAEEAIHRAALEHHRSGRGDDIFYLINYVERFSPNALRALELYLASTMEGISRVFKTQITREFDRVFHSVSFAYQRYRMLPNARLPESTLYPIFKEVMWHNLDRRVEEKGFRAITPNRIMVDWRKWHGRLSAAAIVERIRYFAGSGDASGVQECFESLQQQYPYEEQRKSFFSLIYVHARRADLPNAEKTFQKVRDMASEHGDRLDLPCWNTLLHAYERTNELDKALAVFNELLSEKMTPDISSVHPIATIHARRGDVASVRGVIEQYHRLCNVKKHFHLIGSHMLALIRSGDVEQAQNVLEDAITQFRNRQVEGSPTMSCNFLLLAHALNRDVDGTMRVYAWMKEKKIHMDAYTYGALMQALTLLHQTQAAYKIMTRVMPQANLSPVAIHYAVIMAGFVNQRSYQDALRIYKEMRENNVRDTLSSRKIYLRACALQEQKERRIARPIEEEIRPAPLDVVIKELESTLGYRDGREIALKQPSHGTEPSTTGRDIGEYVEHAMLLHGSRRCLEAVIEMFRRYKAATAEARQSPDPPPMRILTALMRAFCHRKKYEIVEALWKLAKQQADEFAPLTPVPGLTGLQPLEQIGSDTTEDNEASPPDTSDVAEVGFSAASDDEASSPNTSDVAETGPPAEHDTSIGEDETVPSPENSSPLRPPAPGLRHVLSRPLYEYLKALGREERTGDMIQTVSQILDQGYTLDIYTWNRLIESLCHAKPPLVLLAFTLTERYLIQEFPGWFTIRGQPRKSARQHKLQHMRARYLPPQRVMPQYRTLVHLSSGLVWLRRAEAAMGDSMKAQLGEKYRLVGDAKTIAELAPQTLDVVDRMPYVDDGLQRKNFRPR